MARGPAAPLVDVAYSEIAAAEGALTTAPVPPTRLICPRIGLIGRASNPADDAYGAVRSPLICPKGSGVIEPLPGEVRSSSGDHPVRIG
jgi:hypothetical protein